jgi:hypothetical protein
MIRRRDKLHTVFDSETNRSRNLKNEPPKSCFQDIL